MIAHCTNCKHSSLCAYITQVRPIEPVSELHDGVVVYVANLGDLRGMDLKNLEPGGLGWQRNLFIMMRTAFQS